MSPVVSAPYARSMRRRTTPHVLTGWRAMATAATAVLCTAALLMLCQPPTPVSAAAPVEVCVGVVLPVTGPRNVESLRIIDALKMGAEDMTRDPNWMPGTVMNVIEDTAAIDTAGFVQFAGRRMYDQVMTKTCANGTSPLVIIGDLTDELVVQMSTIGTLLKTPIMSPGARDPVFTLDRVSHPYVAVFRSSLKDEAAAILAMFQRMGWTQFVLWHSNSNFGTALTDSFAAASGLEMVDMPVPATDQGTEIKHAITRILTLRYRIIVVHAEPDLARLMMNLSNRAGMLNGDYIFFGSMTWTWGSDVSSAVFNEEEKGYLQGVMGLGIPIPGAPALAFQQRLWARQPLLYPPYFAEMPINTRVCAYDALKAIGLAVKNLTASGLSYTNQNLMRALVAPNIDYLGVSGGRVQMTQSTGSRVSRYQLSNFQNGAFVAVGTWTLATGLVMDPTQSIVWPGMNAEAVPSQVVPRRLLDTSASLDNVAVALGCLYGIASLLLHYLIVINTDHEVIKASSPIFCHIILLGGDVAYLMCALSAMDMDTTCKVVPSLISVCFSLIFGALVAKTYRIHRIFNSQELRIKTPTNTHLFAICGTLLAYDIVVIGAWMGTDKPHAAFINSPNDPTTAYYGCVMNTATSWTMAMFFPKAVLVLTGAWLAYKVRDLNHNFNEARYISLALYNVLIMAAILYGLVAAFPYSVDVVYALKSVGVASCAFITMLILFGPKFWDVYITKDWIDYHSNSSYVSGVLVHKSSKGSYAKNASAHMNATLGADGKPVATVGNLTSDGSGGVRRNETTRVVEGKSSGNGGSGTGVHQRAGHAGHAKRSGGDAGPYISGSPSSKQMQRNKKPPVVVGVQMAGSTQQRSGSPTRGSTAAMAGSKSPVPNTKLPPSAAGAKADDGIVTVTIATPLAGNTTIGSQANGGVSTPSMASPITRTRTSPPQDAEPAPLLGKSASAAPAGSSASATPASVAAPAPIAKSPSAAAAAAAGSSFGYRVVGGPDMQSSGSFSSLNAALTAGAGAGAGSAAVGGGGRNPMAVNPAPAGTTGPNGPAMGAGTMGSMGTFNTHTHNTHTYNAGDGYRVISGGSYPSLNLDTPKSVAGAIPTVPAGQSTHANASAHAVAAASASLGMDVPHSANPHA